MGRPKKQLAEKSHCVQICMTDSEKVTMKSIAQSKGLSLSKLIRNAVEYYINPISENSVEENSSKVD